VQRVHAVGVDEAGQFDEQADPADDHHLVRLQTQLEERRLQRGQDGKSPQPAHNRMDLALSSVLGHFSG